MNGRTSMVGHAAGDVLDRAKLKKQLAILLAVVLLFACFDLGIYLLFTRRVIKRQSSGMLAKSVELADYLPFESCYRGWTEGSGENRESQVARVDTDFRFEGDLPVLDGAAALYPVFSGFVSSVYPEDSVSFSGTDFSPESKLQMRNTRAAYKAIVDGDADIVFCAKPSKEQLAYAQEQGVELELVPIGREAFVFVVNSNNPVNDLTVEQIRGIYSGKYTNWKQLGGLNKHISVLQRNTGSGSQTAMLSFMGDTPIKNDRFSFLGSSIGFSFRYYVSSLSASSGVKMLSLNGVYPSPENVRSEKYPIVSNFYAVYRKNETNPNVKNLLDWILSPEGQKIVEESGYAGV